MSKRYILIDRKGADQFEEYFDSKEAAIDSAKSTWKAFSSHDKKERTDFYVIESANPDPESENHFAGDILYDALNDTESTVTMYGRGLTGDDFEAIATYMEDDLREQVHSELAPYTDEEFLQRYIDLAKDKDSEFLDILRNEFDFKIWD